MSKTILISGASKGFGKAWTEAFLEKGYQVAATARNIDTLNDLKAKYGDAILPLKLDVNNREESFALVEKVKQHFGKIDILINNAGYALNGAVEEASEHEARAQFETNFFGLLRVTNAVLPTMRRQRKGRIINLSSVLGLIPAPYSALYASTKHAIEGYSESLDHELRPFGIRVVLVEPAYTRTSFEENLARPDQLLGVYDAARAGMNVTLRKAIETGDAPEVVARTVLRAATDTVPKRRYAAGKMARQISLLRRFVPASAFDKSLRKQNGLPV